MVRSNYIHFVDYLKFLRHAYKNEDNLIVWKYILKPLTDLSSIFDYASIDNTKKLFQVYRCDLLSNIYDKLLWDPLPNENSQTAMLRGLILSQMGINGHNKTRDEAHERFEKLFTDNYLHHQSIDPNIRFAIYITVAKTGNAQTFEQLKLVRQDR